MKLEKFEKQKRNKKVVFGSILRILIVVGSITLYKTFALYKEEKTFNVLRGQVPIFVKGDLELAISVDGETSSTIPNKGSYNVSITCDKGAEGYWDYEEWGPNIRNITASKVKCLIEFTTGSKLSDYIVKLSETSSEIEKVSHEATEQTPALEDYRYTGANPNNYVYFGCEEECTEENLYRVIGVLPTQSTVDGEYENRVKLIKAKYYTEEESGLLKDTDATYPAGGGSGKGYQWNSSASNQWQGSTLQSRVLNGVYWSSLGEYQNYISPTKWYLGALLYSSYSIYTPDEFYNIERSHTKGYSGGETSFIGTIGLMYPSDYGYSIGIGYRGETIFNIGGHYKSNAWLYNLESKYYEWTMTPESSNSGVGAWHLYPAGHVSNYSVYSLSSVWGIRPVFYLKSNVHYSSGNGTINQPFQIK